MALIEVADDELVVPLSSLVSMFVALRLAGDQPDEELRRRRCDIAIASLPYTVRQRITTAAAQQLRRGLGLDTPFTGAPGHID